MGSGILNNKAYSGVNPEFPLDFFEKTVLITADVKLGGDAIRNGDSEAAKQSLASEDGFLESPSPAGFKVLFPYSLFLVLSVCPLSIYGFEISFSLSLSWSEDVVFFLG